MIDKTHVIVLLLVVILMIISALVHPVMPIAAILIVFISVVLGTAIIETIKSFKKNK